MFISPSSACEAILGAFAEWSARVLATAPTTQVLYLQYIGCFKSPLSVSTQYMEENNLQQEREMCHCGQNITRMPPKPPRSHSLETSCISIDSGRLVAEDFLVQFLIPHYPCISGCQGCRGVLYAYYVQYLPCGIASIARLNYHHGSQSCSSRCFIRKSFVFAPFEKVTC